MKEKNHPYNGILLCSNHDVLYSQGYIAFNGQGYLHISPLIPEVDYEKYGLIENLKIHLQPDNKQYFLWHKRNFFNEK